MHGLSVTSLLSYRHLFIVYIYIYLSHLLFYRHISIVLLSHLYCLLVRYSIALLSQFYTVVLLRELLSIKPSGHMRMVFLSHLYCLIVTSLLSFCHIYCFIVTSLLSFCEISIVLSSHLYCHTVTFLLSYCANVSALNLQDIQISLN